MEHTTLEDSEPCDYRKLAKSLCVANLQLPSSMMYYWDVLSHARSLKAWRGSPAAMKLQGKGATLSEVYKEMGRPAFDFSKGTFKGRLGMMLALSQELIAHGHKLAKEVKNGQFFIPSRDAPSSSKPDFHQQKHRHIVFTKKSARCTVCYKLLPHGDRRGSHGHSFKLTKGRVSFTSKKCSGCDKVMCEFCFFNNWDHAAGRPTPNAVAPKLLRREDEEEWYTDDEGGEGE